MEEKSKNYVKDKYLLFYLDNEIYGIEILKVKEIIGLLEITKVPQTPKFLKGVINLRGKVIPVIDMRLKLGLEEKPYTRETCIIVINLDDKLIGLIVDTVKEVLTIPEKNITTTPSFGIKINVEFLKGIGKINEKVIILLNIEKILNSEELILVQDISKEDENKEKN